MNAPAQVTIDRPHERAASRARLDKAHSTAADRANDRRQTEDDTPKKINKGGSGPRCKQRKAQRGARLTSGMHPEDER
jgi:hypothetical protein